MPPSGHLPQITFREDHMGFLVSGVVSLCLAAVFLVTPAVHAEPTDDPGIQQRLENQDRRIEQGIASGRLTPREAGRLEAEQLRIARMEKKMASDGRLTGYERARLHDRLDQSSSHIYRLKHNYRAKPVAR